jgi:hypothetical protein
MILQYTSVISQDGARQLNSHLDPFYIITDRGFHNVIGGTYGIVIGQSNNVIAINNGQLYNMSYYDSLFRTELYGLLTRITTEQYIAQQAKSINHSREGLNPML